MFIMTSHIQSTMILLPTKSKTCISVTLHWADPWVAVVLLGRTRVARRTDAKPVGIIRHLYSAASDSQLDFCPFGQHFVPLRPIVLSSFQLARCVRRTQTESAQQLTKWRFRGSQRSDNAKEPVHIPDRLRSCRVAVAIWQRRLLPTLCASSWHSFKSS